MSQRTTLTINPLNIIYRRIQKDENNCRRHKSGWKVKLKTDVQKTISWPKVPIPVWFRVSS